MSAKFQHDCQRCKFLMRFENVEFYPNGLDIYYCPPEFPEGKLGGSVVCRFSSEQKDYYSERLYVFRTALQMSLDSLDTHKSSYFLEIASQKELETWRFYAAMALALSFDK